MLWEGLSFRRGEWDLRFRGRKGLLLMLRKRKGFVYQKGRRYDDALCECFRRKTEVMVMHR